MSRGTKTRIAMLLILVYLSCVCWIGYEAGWQTGWQKGYDKAWADYELGFEHGRRSQHDYKPEYQTSEFQTRDTFGDKLLKTLCEREGIDYDNDEFLFTCPKCTKGGARIQQSPAAAVYYGFITKYPELESCPSNEGVAMTTDFSQTYCYNCLYPVGTDWKIIDLGEQ